MSIKQKRISRKKKYSLHFSAQLKNKVGKMQLFLQTPTRLGKFS